MDLQAGRGLKFAIEGVPEIDFEKLLPWEDRQQLLRVLDEDQRAPDVEPESPAPFGDQSQDLRFFGQAAPQQDQPGLEVVFEIWQLERPVEANLAVRELNTLLTVVNPEQLP